ncbi:hypothetical protein LOTGIDRAFT_160630 [Lottia gigantea]|uniref:F-BAR domain-containing protein n=1 Tax=Lottia gigantea TaxID=225164 RepID=V4AF33_LOTGI|nr:hypothetical protein LOTGIDRAFT_160630 [Lottia gigantea]ESO95477.1 hypothetical protein LOTGIDRAFT_160630 [Lottia gigantea]
MEKAAKVMRRSSVRLLSLGGGQSDLNVLISELKDMRNTQKAYQSAQTSDQLKDYRQTWERVLEGEKHVLQSKNHLLACDQRENKLKRELKKAYKKAPRAELEALESKLAQAERAKDVAQLEVNERTRENEAVKLIRIKEGLLKFSNSYIDFAHNTAVVFESQRNIALQLPDVHDQELEDIKYTGSGATKHYVMKAKEEIKKNKERAAQSPYCEPPPPYSPCDNLTSDSSYNSSLNTSSNQGASPRRRSHPAYQARQITAEDYTYCSDGEEDLNGAMGGMNIS